MWQPYCAGSILFFALVVSSDVEANDVLSQSPSDSGTSDDGDDTSNSRRRSLLPQFFNNIFKPKVERHQRTQGCSWTRELPGMYFEPRSALLRIIPGISEPSVCVEACGRTPGCQAVNLFAPSRGRFCSLLSERSPPNANPSYASSNYFNGYATRTSSVLIAREFSRYIDGIYCNGQAQTNPQPPIRPPLPLPQPVATPTDNTVSESTCGIQPPPSSSSNPFSSSLSLINGFIQKRIMGGWEARANSWPWLVAILKKGSIACGGALLRPDVIVTAAHCLESGTLDLTVVAGAHSLRDLSGPDVERRTIRDYIIHEEYNTAAADQDIGLAQLDRPVRMGPKKGVICLPPQGHHPNDGTQCVVAGWGLLTDAPGLAQLPNGLQETYVNIINRDFCNSPERFAGKITPYMFCAGIASGLADACVGDSGGPLACRNAAGAWMISGIISWGNGCAKAQYPGVYTKVAQYTNWITATLARFSS